MALSMSLTDVLDFRGSAAFASHAKAAEGRGRYQAALLQRFDGISKGIAALGKLIARSQR